MALTPQLDAKLKAKRETRKNRRKGAPAGANHIGYLGGEAMIVPAEGQSLSEQEVAALAKKRDPYDDPIADVSELRDITIGLMDRKRMSYQMIKERGGASPSTLTKWAHKETKRPHLATLVRTLRTMDHDLRIVPKKWNEAEFLRRRAEQEAAEAEAAAKPPEGTPPTAGEVEQNAAPPAAESVDTGQA